MDEAKFGTEVASTPRATEVDVGGLRFSASFRGAGATLRVCGRVGGAEKELLRFDDFIDAPHYHVPADGAPIMFDRAALGEPLDWFVIQLRDHLAELLTAGGFAEMLADVDVTAIADQAETLRALMTDCLPEGYVRIAGVGLRRVET